MEDSELRHQFVTRLQHRVNLFSDILLNKPWQIWRVPDGKQFVTSDNPVMTFLTDDWGRYTVGHSLGKEGVVILLPISPAACIAAGIFGYADRMIAEADVLEVNKMIISGASRFAYSRDIDPHIDTLAQEFIGSVQYGVNAFRGSDEEFDDLFLS
jgi:hypothetical protein